MKAHLVVPKSLTNVAYAEDREHLVLIALVCLMVQIASIHTVAHVMTIWQIIADKIVRRSGEELQD